MLAAASVRMKAVILLSANCGFGNHKCGTLPSSALDLDSGWIGFPRPTTGVAHRCPLWPELVDVLRAAIGSRPTPRNERHANLVFPTKFGEPWAKETENSPVTKKNAKVVG